MNRSRHPVQIGLFGLGVWLMCSQATLAQDSRRAGKSELFGVMQYFQGDSQSTSLSGFNVTLDFDDTVLYGAGFGYNLAEWLNVNGELLYGSTDFDFRINGLSGTDDTDIVQLNLNLDYNILPTRLTPVVTGGVGIIIFNGDVGFLDFSEADVSYSFGGGIRWDVTDQIFVKVLYRRIRTELEDFDDQHEFDTVNIYLGIMF